ncbi:septal ring lytic transglycosylase RlpA family protein [Bailinhaonella thermotolerans]|uniref:Probable endolytic peptidoglycan transglycosylase RlpA n=1 Tax=Bailinhaonella thermotolerans TaxID=1070861 RepID=A0A3A4AZX6_9ACTN|nr:septal ring lytic transglycosylase RlpA family protein [Bailinhaonella thermotolerans]
MIAIGAAGVVAAGTATGIALASPGENPPPSAHADAGATSAPTPAASPSASPAATPSATPAATAGPAAAPSATPTAAPSPSATAEPKTEPKAAPKPKAVVKPKKKKTTRVLSSGSCQASFYWEGQMTANGERFNPSALTAAHKTLPFNSRVRVTNPSNGKSVVVRINDRGPFISGRCLDLSRAAFTKIGDPGAGVMPVKYEVLARS